MKEPLWYPLPDKNMVHFEYATEKNESVSAQCGRPVHDKVIRATIVSAGSRKSEATMLLERERAVVKEGDPVSRKIYESALDSLPGLREALDRFKRDEKPAEGSGTPLEDWPTLDVRQVADLKALNVHFVEQLAGASDATLQAIGMGARPLQAKAKAFLAAAAGQAPLDAMVEQNDQLKRQNELLAAQLAEMKAKQETADAR